MILLLLPDEMLVEALSALRLIALLASILEFEQTGFRFVCTVHAAVLLVVQVEVAAHPVHRLERRVWNFHCLHIPHRVAVRDDRIIAAQLAAERQRGQAPPAELLRIPEDAISFDLRLPEAIVSDLHVNLVELQLVDVLQVAQEIRPDVAKQFLIADLIDDDGHSLRPFNHCVLLLKIVFADEQTDILAQSLVNPDVGGVFRADEQAAIHREFQRLGRAGLLARGGQLVIDVHSRDEDVLLG